MVIEENVRKDMMNKQPGNKVSKKVPKATTKPAKTTQKVLKKKQTTVEKSDDTAEAVLDLNQLQMNLSLKQNLQNRKGNVLLTTLPKRRDHTTSKATGN